MTFFLSIVDIKGSAPTVLLLYSYDCQNHLSCVQSLALLLQNALGCTVMADFWATQEIAERGITALRAPYKVYFMVLCITSSLSIKSCTGVHRPIYLLPQT